MSAIQTAYNPTGFTLSSAREGVRPGGGGADLGFFMDIIKKKLAWEDAFNQRKLEAMDEDLGNRNRVQGRNIERAQPTALERARESAELAKLSAETNPQPMKFVSGFNYAGKTPDVDAMNAYQRQAYLPASASAQFDPQQSYEKAQRLQHELGQEDADAEAARQEKVAEDADYERRQAQMRALMYSRGERASRSASERG